MARTPYIFGIGAAKTGSNSLAGALRQFGIKVNHLGTDRFSGDDSVHSAMLDNMKTNKPPTLGIEGMEALIDHPVHTCFRELDATVEDAKFILTYRPPDDCALSWCRMIARHPENIKPDWPTGFLEYANLVRQHNDKVLKHFLHKPGKLFVLDCRDRADAIFSGLAKFLGREQPQAKKYPRHFDHQNWK